MNWFARKLLLFCLLILCVNTKVFPSYMDDIVTIVNNSNTGKTILVDRGRAHEYVENDYGILLAKQLHKDPDTGVSRNVFKPVAKLKLIKLYRNSSIWISLRSYIPELLTKNTKLLLLSESKLLKGRSELKISRSKVVSKKGKLIENVKANIKEDGLNLAKKDKKYIKAYDIHGKQKDYESDVELIDIDIWEDRAGRKKYSQTAIFKSPNAKDFSERKRVATFEKMAFEFLSKYNDPNFTLKRLYYNQEKSKVIPIFAEKNLTSSAFDRYAYEESKRLEKEKILVNDLKSKGEVWSDGYSDEELSELLYNVNSISEIERRKVITSYHFNYQLFLSTGVNLVNNDVGGDAENARSVKFDIEGAIEGHFFKRIRLLNNFTLEFAFRRNQDSFDIGSQSAQSTEYSASGGINWYPFHVPNMLETNVFFIGLLVRSGLADLAIPSQGEKGNYQVYSLPGIKTGFKYNFNNSWGARASLGIENIRMERIVRNDAAGDLPDRANYQEYKLSIGLSKFF